MGERDFQEEVIDRLARIETKQDIHGETVAEQGKTISAHSISIEGTSNSVKSAHHRIDGICATAGLLGAVAGWAANFVASIWPKGGH